MYVATKRTRIVHSTKVTWIHSLCSLSQWTNQNIPDSNDPVMRRNCNCNYCPHFHATNDVLQESFESSNRSQHNMVFSKSHDAWRNHPRLTNPLRKTLPGFGYAVGIFSVYLAVDAVLSYNPASSHSASEKEHH